MALLRGINVGGRNKLPMAGLRQLLGEMGLQKVQTYIQSGNVVFEVAAARLPMLGEEMGGAIEAAYGFRPQVMLVDAEAWETAVARNPFAQAEAEPKAVHLYFLAEPPAEPRLDKMDEIKRDSEVYALIGQTFYLYAPEGIGRSKLAAQAERLLGVAATARNWRTVSQLTMRLRGA